MQIVNTYFDKDRDLWWKINNSAFYKTNEIHQASSFAFGCFNEWVKNHFVKVEIGVTHD